MRILELLLPKGSSDRSLSPQVVRKIDALQTRMDSYVDKITNSNTSKAGKDFLKKKLKNDLAELKEILPEASESTSTKYEVYDKKTKQKVSGPYATASRARLARDKKDSEYGAVRYGIRPVGETEKVNEVFKAPVPWEWETTGPTYAVANFVVKKEPYKFMAVRQDPKMKKWNILFKATREEHNHRQFDTLGTGNAYQVFSTVINIIDDFLRRYRGSVDYIVLSAFSDSKQKLYIHMINKLFPDATIRKYGFELVVTLPHAVEMDQQVSEANHIKPIVYSTDDTTFKHRTMPTLKPDPVDNADSIDTLRNEPYEHDFDSVLDAKKEVGMYMDRLSTNDQKFLHLRFWEELMIVEIAEILNISPSLAFRQEERIFQKIKDIKSRELRGLTEAVTKLPLSTDDFEYVKKVMERPIPAAVAPIYIHQIIEDDELNSELAALEESDPGLDVRPLIAEWFKRVMPDQMYRFTDDVPNHAQKEGVLSVIHGYDSHEYKGENNPITGDAYGFR